MKPLKTGLLTLICLLGIIPSAIAQDTVGKITLHGIKKNGAATFTGAAPKGFNYSSAPRVQRHPDLIAASAYIRSLRSFGDVFAVIPQSPR